MQELDRVLGGGIVPGSVVLLAGEPGVGKSTLLLSMARQWAAGAGSPALIVSGEESTAQVRLRAERTGAVHENLYLAAENDLGAVLSHIDDVSPGLLIVDSVQTVAADSVEAAAGSVSQIRAVTAALIAQAKARGMATVVVGHVTKDGGIAGPRVLEHLVDVVLVFEGDRHSSLRLLRSTKNRYGAADEVGCFEMREDGIAGLADPSGLFLSQRSAAVPGTCVTVTIEGRRPMLAEVQALVIPTGAATPRRAVTGLDAARVAMLTAVIHRHTKTRLIDREVYAGSIGGIALTEPAADLAIALAIGSAEAELPMPQRLCAIGEVSLSGDVRRVSGLERRLAEAIRLGFTVALVPRGHVGDAVAPRAEGITVVPISTVQDALTAVGNLRHNPAPKRSTALRTVN